jgi:pimeloyl-ACP methyl ester carboxylesterase
VRLARREWAAAAADAPVALLLHGITGSSGTWWRVGPALADAGWRVVALDLPGHGDSPRMDAPMKIPDWAASVRESVAGEAIDLAIGHSSGGGTLVEAVSQDPTLARRIVVEEPPGAGDAPRPDWAAQLEREVAAARRAPERIERLLLRQNPSWLRRDAREAVAALRASDIEVIAEMERRGMGYRVAELVPTLTVPTLLMLAEEDRSSLRAEARRAVLDGAPPTMTVRHFPTGHVIHSDAFDEYVATIVAWANSG